MASGFIVLADGRCFARRWRAYDEIIRIVIREATEIPGGKLLTEWLKLQIPENEDIGDREFGWGFFDSRSNQVINRMLDLRSLTPENQSIFRKSIQTGREKLSRLESAYSPLHPYFLLLLDHMFELVERGEPPMELSDWKKLAEPCTEQNGPGWDKG